jgi:para-nitrobenzyl esterase
VIVSAIANTTSGKVEGSQTNGLCVFRGIPFAAPPIGKRRWLPPSPPEPWSGVRSAKSFGTIAPQHAFFEVGPDNEVLFEFVRATAPRVREPQSEDCLYLNVATPGVDDAQRPVMLWIHGGGFHSGSGSVYDGSSLSKRGDVVVVTINYRLGPLGFLNLNEVTGGKISASGNEGLLDQVAALTWVRENISAFGGDPNNVTIFGESAGGMSVGALLGLPAAKGLFHKVIAQSGAANQAVPLKKAVRVAERFLDALGLSASDVDTIRSLSTQQLVTALANVQPKPGEPPDPEIGGAPMQPVIDGTVLPDLPLDLVGRGSADGVRVITGSNLEEQKLFSVLRPEVASFDDTRMQAHLRGAVPGWDPTRVIETYRAVRAKRHASVTPPELYDAIESDRVFRMSSVRLAEVLRDRGQCAYNYLFNWKSPLMNGAFGACHALDLGFLWGTYKDSPKFYGAGPAADRLATAIQDAWLSFAQTGDPSCPAVGNWPCYGARRETMMLGEQCVVEDAPYDDERRAWDSTPNTVVGWV